jgi:hypothetical protein
MPKVLFSLLASVLATSAAYATPPNNNPGAPTANQHVGITNINAAVAATRSDARSSSRSRSSATGGAAQASGGSLNLAGASMGGAGGVGHGGTGGAATGGTVNLSLTTAASTMPDGYLGLLATGAALGGTSYPRQTPPSYPGEARTPIKSCRLTMGGGGADDKVSLALGFPIGNDNICLHAVRDQTMEAANRRSVKAVFTPEDFLRNDCSIEGMEATRACRELKERDQQPQRTATAPAAGNVTASAGSLQLLP